MADVERSNAGSNAPPNPYSSGPPPLPPYVDKMKRIIYMAISVYGLVYFNFFRVLFKSPHIRHEWFQIGLACTIAILFIKAYVEMYEGRVRKVPIHYDNFRQTTHAVLGLILASTVAFNVALWPHYGSNSLFILGLFFFGVILQFMLLVPTSVQNMVAMVGLTFFLQEYSGYSNLVQ